MFNCDVRERYFQIRTVFSRVDYGSCFSRFYSMDTDDNGMSSVPVDTTKDVDASNVCKVCKVCGNNTAVMYLGVRCCSPCKMFFRRNADFDLVSQFFVYFKEYFPLFV
jgi:hypothetical protein